MPAHDLETLRTFRTDLYGCFPRRADALFELGDALLAAEANPSLPHLSLQAAHRRGWGSLYDALAKGTIDGAALRATLPQDLADKQPVSAMDRSIWPRCDAEASPERGFYYHPLPSLAPLGRAANRCRVGVPVVGPADFRAG